MKKILVIEDNGEVRENLEEILELSGYDVLTAEDGKVGVEKALTDPPDLILCDVMMPHLDGFGVLNILSKKSSTANVPFIFLTAKAEKSDFRRGMNLGADDYITKPFHLAELNSRINSLIRRRKFGGDDIIQFNEIRIDPGSKTATVNGKPIELTKKEYNLLLYFVTNKDKVLTKESIAEHLWGDDIEMADSFDFIYTHMGNLRKKMKKLGAPNYLRTMYGLGYKFGDK